MADLEDNSSDSDGEVKKKPESSLQEDMNEDKAGDNPQEGMNAGDNPQEGMNVCLSCYTYC